MTQAGEKENSSANHQEGPGVVSSSDAAEDATMEHTLEGGRDSEVRRRRLGDNAMQASDDGSAQSEAQSRSAIDLLAETLPPNFDESQSISDSQAGLIAPSDIAPGSRAISRVRGEGGDYEILGPLGEGGMGVVYRARQNSVGRVIALKTVKQERAADPAVRGKFLSEAVVTADLEHPNIVPVYDLGENADAACFYAMKHVKGVPWEDVIDEKNLEDNLDILMRVSDAIAFAHSRGVIHRDLKPENVMLGDFGEVLVMDWGLGASVTESGRATPLKQCNPIAGTPTYMAPEMAGGIADAIGPLSDVYLLGGILYRIVAKHPPHHGASVRDCLQNAAANIIVPTGEKNELIEIALKAMATAPADRYPSVKDFQAAVRECLRHHESIVLAARARDELEKARASKEYHDFARALFGNEEALLLWEGNSAARKAIREVRLAYAQCAFEKGDFDLAESLLEEGGLKDEELLKEVQRAKRKRAAQEKRAKIASRVAAGAIQAQSSNAEKLKTLKIASVVLGVLVLVGGAVSGIVIWREKKNAIQLSTEIERLAVEVAKQHKVAEEQKEMAEKQRQIAEEHKNLAEMERAKAEAALRRAEEADKARDAQPEAKQE